MQLNIIGNGFDLYHGLPSSYYFFGCYLIKNDMEFYEKIGKMYGLHYTEMIGPSIAHEYEYVVEDIFWRDFEKHLGEVDEYFIVDTYEDDLGLENDDPVYIEMNEDMIAERLKHFFVHWVKDTLDQDKNYELIAKIMDKATNIIEFGYDYFLVFNYTHTLQKIYNISEERIHYVHGECLGNDDDLVIGHGNDYRIQQIKSDIEKFKEEYDYTQKSSNKINEYQCLLRFLNKLRKDVDFCKYMCELFYENMGTDLDCINVYGMSIGDVDIPYFIHIREKWPDTHWRFSYHSTEDRIRVVEVATNILHLKKEEYDIFKFSNILYQEIQEEIVKLQNIKKY
ncbi:AbiH family protein [Sedimentibacter saalensis]|uniref:AbiH family protein n=1 Tax=Sedimentibacter saalensis TaxID=130788 RepID=UPI0028A0EA1C|nr:AbiH family protein [Sedimentibacter saalensis]